MGITHFTKIHRLKTSNTILTLIGVCFNFILKIDYNIVLQLYI